MGTLWIHLFPPLPAMSKVAGQSVSSSVGWKTVWKKEYSEVKPAWIGNTNATTATLKMTSLCLWVTGLVLFSFQRLFYHRICSSPTPMIFFLYIIFLFSFLIYFFLHYFSFFFFNVHLHLLDSFLSLIGLIIKIWNKYCVFIYIFSVCNTFRHTDTTLTLDCINSRTNWAV